MAIDVSFYIEFYAIADLLLVMVPSELTFFLSCYCNLMALSFQPSQETMAKMIGRIAKNITWMKKNLRPTVLSSAPLL
jgi:hypothetical protein